MKKMKRNLTAILLTLTVSGQMLPLAATAVETPDAQYETVLCASRKKISQEDTNRTVYFYADTLYEGANITLIEAATGEAVATLVDDGAYSVSGDDLPLDGVYSCKVEIPLATEEALQDSRFAEPSYYVQIQDESGTYRSNSVTLKLYKPLTEQELADMHTVDAQIQALMDSEEFQAASLEERMTLTAALLTQLAQPDETLGYALIQDYVVHTSEDSVTVSFNYACGIAGGAVLYRDPNVNIDGGSDTEPAVTTVTTEDSTATSPTTATTTKTASFSTEAPSTTASPEVTTASETTSGDAGQLVIATAPIAPIQTSTCYGDVNLDGRVDLLDAVLLSKACSDMVTLPEAAKVTADCALDGVIDGNDTTALLQFLVGLTNFLPYYGLGCD